MIFLPGCDSSPSVSRDDFANTLTRICRQELQTRVVVKAADETVWIYLPYTPGRQGRAEAKPKGSTLYLEYTVASFNPYKVIDPPELKFIIQKVIGRVRALLLSCPKPYRFFVLVVSDISSPLNPQDDWNIGYYDDVRLHKVGADFSGEGYDRLTWHPQRLDMKTNADGKSVSPSYLDVSGDHVPYHDMILDDFIVKQIKWRIYKRFNLEYNKTPFDMTAQEKKDEVLGIVKTVFLAYNYDRYDTVYLRDQSFLDEQESYIGFTRYDLKKYPKDQKELRRPAF